MSPFITIRTCSNDQKGAAAVEFGLIATVLFMLLFGIFAFGAIYSQHQVFQGAAREGARVAAARGASPTALVDPAEVRTRVAEAAEPYEVTGPISISVEGGGEQCTSSTIGRSVTVSWPQSYDISLPLIPKIKKDVTIRGVFRCE
jgi:Flp pilus assembly protein TadG